MNKTDAQIAMGIGIATGFYFQYLLGQRGVLEKLGILANWLWLLPIVFGLLAPTGLWICWRVSKKWPFVWQLAKFLLIGVIATIFDLGTLAIFIGFSGINSGASFNLFKGASFIIATILKYVPDKFWAFKQKETQNVKKEFAQFFTVTLIGLGINVFIADMVVNQIGPQWGLPRQLWANLGGIAAVVAVFAWNFAGYKFFVFKK